MYKTSNDVYLFLLSLQNDTIDVIIVSRGDSVFVESNKLEFKEKYSKSILKTVSAFANYREGRIIIGVSDYGYAIGVKDVFEERLRIENSINDSITPRPMYDINVLVEDDVSFLEIVVYKGDDGPYYYNSKAYTRNDTSTIAVDSHALTRLALQAKHITYDQLPSEVEGVSFDYLGKQLNMVLGIEIDHNVLTTLGIYTKGVISIAGELLSDRCNLRQSTIDLVKLDLSGEVIQDRVLLERMSLLEMYDKSIDFFNRYYKPVEIIEDGTRKKIDKIPLNAFREALINAIVHRDYISSGTVQITFFDNRIEVRSPGGLPEHLPKELYLGGYSSLPRNSVLSYVFFRLGLMEQLGTGVRRIISSYRRYKIEPSFVINDHQVKVILPVIRYDYSKLNKKDRILHFLEAFPHKSRKEMEQYLSLDRSFVIRRLNEFIEEKLVLKEGNAMQTIYYTKENK